MEEIEIICDRCNKIVLFDYYIRTGKIFVKSTDIEVNLDGDFVKCPHCQEKIWIFMGDDESFIQNIMMDFEDADREYNPLLFLRLMHLVHQLHILQQAAYYIHQIHSKV